MKPPDDGYPYPAADPEAGPEQWRNFNDEVAALYRKHVGPLMGRLVGWGATPALVEDVVQDSFLALRRKWPEIRRYEKPEAYLYKVARYRLFDAAREPGWVELDPEQLEWSLPPADLGESSPVAMALRELTPRQRDVVLFRYLHEFSCRQTAGILGISEGAVKKYLSEGRQKLRELLASSADREADR